MVVYVKGTCPCKHAQHNTLICTMLLLPHLISEVFRLNVVKATKNSVDRLQFGHGMPSLMAFGRTIHMNCGSTIINILTDSNIHCVFR